MNVLADQLNELLHYCHSLAKLLLNEQGEFYPFGVYLNANNVITQRMFNDGDDFPLSTGLINIIKYDFDEQILSKNINASAITYEAKVTNSQYLQPTSVIVVRFNAQGMKSPILHYLPYQIIEGKAEYMTSWTEAE